MLTLDDVRLLYQNDVAHDFEHVLRVWANAERIGQAEGARLDILRVAVLLHDIARIDQERHGLDHAIEGARQARNILSQADYPPDFIEAVCQAIETHRYRIKKPPKTLEAKILYDADKLDSLGAIGLARAFAYSGHVQRALWLADDQKISTRQHLQEKLIKVKETLFTETARQIAMERHQFMEQFVAQISAEIKGER